MRWIKVHDNNCEENKYIGIDLIRKRCNDWRFHCRYCFWLQLPQLRRIIILRASKHRFVHVVAKSGKHHPWPWSLNYYYSVFFFFERNEIGKWSVELVVCLRKIMKSIRDAASSSISITFLQKQKIIIDFHLTRTWVQTATARMCARMPKSCGQIRRITLNFNSKPKKKKAMVIAKL